MEREPIKSHKDLKVYQMAFDVAMKIFEASKKFPVEERYSRFFGQLLDQDYPNARKVKLLCDNLNTHHIASLYEAFSPEEAHRLARRWEIYYTPRNGSWLNVTEIELSVLHQQCLKRRIDNPHTLELEIAAWQHQRNLEAAQVRWRFTTVDASIKLSHLYPTH